MKRLIFTVTNDLTYDQRMIRICSTLSQAGYSVLLVGRKKKSSVSLYSYNYEQKRLRCFFQRGKLFYLEYQLRLLVFLLFQSFDIVCAIDLDTILPCYWAGSWKKKPCVYDAHEYFTETPEVVRRPFVKWVWEKVAAYAIPRIPYCYTVGEALADIFQARYGVAFSVIRNVPVYYSLSPVRPKDRDVILYQGVLNEGRGLEQAVAAMNLIDNAELWLVGEGDLSEKLRSLVIESQLGGKVIFHGFVPPEMLRKITAKATIGINLLENKGLSYYYSLANKAFDYIQAGLPSINMDFPEYRKINITFDVFYLIPDLSPKLVATAIQNLLHDSHLYTRLQNNCLSARKELSWRSEKFKLIEFYRAIH